MTQPVRESFLLSKSPRFRSFPEKKPFAVFVHVFHLDVWEDIIKRLESTVEEPFHLIVTAPHFIAGNLPLPTSQLLVSSQIIPCENRGRDVRPFCEALRLPLDFEVGLKLHTKRSLHRLDGGDWGQMLINSLLPDKEGVRQLHHAMTRDPRLVLVAPDGMLVSQDVWMQDNRRSMNTLAKRFSLDLNLSLKRTPVFVAGTMFWFRKEALKPLLETSLDDLFEFEEGQIDGTTAHALERWIAPIAELKSGITTTVAGVISINEDISDEDLRMSSRRLVDRPNKFLVPLGFSGRLIANSPILKRSYMSLPIKWRRKLKEWILYRKKSTKN